MTKTKKISSNQHKDQIGTFYILKFPQDNLNYDDVIFETTVDGLIKLAREGFTEENISGIYTNPKQAKSLAIRSLKEKCGKMKMERESGIAGKLKEKDRLTRLINASKRYLKSSENHVMLDEENISGYEADLTRLDLEIDKLTNELKILKTKKFTNIK